MVSTSSGDSGGLRAGDVGLPEAPCDQGFIAHGDRGERPGSVREAQLSAISDLSLPPFMTKADVALLFGIPASSVSKGVAEYLDGLLEAIAPFQDEAMEPT